MHITFIQTGGTIDNDYPKSEKGWAFEITSPAVERILEKLNPTFEFEIISLFKKDSLEITNKDRSVLKERIEGLTSKKIIITHGTDTLIETAQFLQDIPDKTIILTGAMRPERFSNSDAPINIGIAIGAVICHQFGTFVCMHGQVIPAQQATRDTESHQFGSI